MAENEENFIDWGAQDETEAHEENQDWSGDGEGVVTLDDDQVAALDGDAVEFTDYEAMLDLPATPEGGTEAPTTDLVLTDYGYQPVYSDEPEENVTVVQVDPHTGQEITQVVNLTSPPLSEDEARALTERIRSTTNVLYLLIKRAHAGKAYKALGYDSFAEYIREEFSFSRAYAYRLLDQANIIEAIEDAAPEGTKIYIGNPTTRELKKVLPLIIADVEERTQDLDPTEAVDVIEDIIREHREQQRSDAEDDDFGDEGYNGGGPYEGSGNGNGMGGGVDYEDDFVEGDEEVDAFNDSDPGDQARLFNTLYNVYAGMKGIIAGAEADNEQIIQLIPAEREAEFDSMFDSTLVRLQALSDLLKEKRAGATLDGLDEDSASEDSDFDGDADPDSDF